MMFHQHFGGRRGHRHMRKVWEAFEACGDVRMRRGDVKFAILGALAERSMHGYDIMQRLEEQSGGRYRPSPGSVYPTVQMLEDGGFVSGELSEGKRVYTITDAGRKLLAERSPEEHGERERAGEYEDWSDLRDSARKFAEAVRQGFTTFDPATRERIRKVLDDARREIYTILSETN